MQEKDRYQSINELRNKIIDLSLIISIAIGFLAYGLSLSVYEREGFKMSYISDLIVLLALLILTLYRKRASIKLKSYVIVLAIFFTVVFDVIHLGVFSANKVLIVLLPFFSAMVFDSKKAYALLLFAIIIFMMIGYFHLSGKLHTPPQDHITLSAWIINILLITVVSIIILIIQNKFNYTNKKLILNLEENNELISEQERNYRKIFNSSTDAIFIHGLDGEILDVNNSILKMFGYDKEDVDLFELDILSSGKDIYTQHDAKVYMKKAIEGTPQVFDWQAIKKNGELFWVEVALKIINLKGVDRILAVVRDINDKKESELQLALYREHLKDLVARRTKELEQANKELHVTNDNLIQQKEELIAAVRELQLAQEQLVRSEKMASLGILSASIAHEINNPLNFIQGGLFGLNNYFNEKAEAHKENVTPLLNAISVGVERASGIVSSLNNFSRTDDTKTVECDIHQIIDGSLLMLNNKIKDRVEIKKEYTKQDFKLIGNEGQLHQVMVNVLLNASQSIVSNGVITIRTEIDNKNLILSVNDNGSGISEDNLAKIFDPFFTTKDAGEGTGLGLAISLKIIENHKGQIAYKSEINKGTEVIISLPINVS